MAQNNVVIPPIVASDISGNVGSCQMSVSSPVTTANHVVWRETVQYATNSCDGSVREIHSWSIDVIVILPLIVLVTWYASKWFAQIIIFMSEQVAEIG